MIRSGRRLPAREGGGDNAGSCLHELLGTGCEAGSSMSLGKAGQTGCAGSLTITQSWRLGWDIGSHTDRKKSTQGQGGRVRRVSGPPISGGQMGFAEAGNRYQLNQGSRVQTNSAMALERWESFGLVGPSLPRIPGGVSATCVNTWQLRFGI